MSKITISKEGYFFTAEDKSLPGMPPVGRGLTMNDVLANWLRLYAKDLGITLEVDDSAWADEMIRRSRELSQR